MTTTALQVRQLMPGLTVNDLQQSLRFYEGLGFSVSQRWETDGVLKGVSLEAGQAKLGLSQDDFAKGRNRVKGVGMSFYFETEQDLEALARQAKTAGITEGQLGPMPWGPLGFQVSDPDGFKLMFANPG